MQAVNLEKELESIKETLRRIETQSRQKTTWVNAAWIMRYTGWTAGEMRDARNQKIVTYKKKHSGSFEYLLESLPEQFIIRKQVA